MKSPIEQDPEKQARCKTKYYGQTGPRCILSAGHKGLHKYLCAGPYCTGYSWAASESPHPHKCVTGAGEK